MANFVTALTDLYSIEGVYSLDPDDPGGETVYGVARKKWPNVPLWKLVDGVTGQDLKTKMTGRLRFTKLIAESGTIHKEVEAFYRKEFWNSFDCDNLPQAIAEELFEQSVNLGVRQCSLHLQRSLNLLNRNETVWADIDADGKVGPATRKALQEAIKKDASYLLGLLNIMQGAFYIQLKNEKYIRGWIKRAQWVY